jgi:hypothetical protein
MSGTAPAPAEELRYYGGTGSEGLEGLEETKQPDAPAEARQPQAEPDAGADAEPVDEAEPREEGKAALTEEQQRRQSENRRYGRIVAARYAAQRRAEEAERQLQELQRRLDAVEHPERAQQPPQPADLDRLVEERAQQLRAVEESQAKVRAWDTAGRQDYGAEPFKAACNDLANISTEQERINLLGVAVDVEGSHRGIMALSAQPPAEIHRVLALPPHKLALELAKLSSAPGPAASPSVQRQASRAPAPADPPVGGRARGEPRPDGSMEDFVRWSESMRWHR